MAKDQERSGAMRALDAPHAPEDKPALPGAPKATAESPPADQAVTLPVIGDRLISLAGQMKSGHFTGQKLHDELVRLGTAAKSGGRL